MIVGDGRASVALPAITSQWPRQGARGLIMGFPGRAPVDRHAEDPVLMPGFARYATTGAATSSAGRLNDPVESVDGAAR